MNDLDNVVKVRQVTKSDLFSNRSMLLELLVQIYSVNFAMKDHLELVASKDYKDMLRFHEDGSAIILGAFEKDSIVGFLWCYIRDVLGEARIHVKHFGVIPEMRSRGLGTKLLNRLESLAKVKEINRIELVATLDNLEAIRFYESRGFEPVRIHLEKDLNP
ncbi:MAG TPA: hypothetical protein DCE14_07860 [Kosmotogaceae bacterium]|nr:hypothetical protein [Kosmotogaceae bacterium]